MKEIEKNAEKAADFLKGLANAHRLMILCQLLPGEKSVSELITLTGLPQTSMSQHLGKLRKEGIVDYRREHRVLYYSITHEAAFKVMNILYDIYCDKGEKQ